VQQVGPVRFPSAQRLGFLSPCWAHSAKMGPA
jgi:hypothetical protein